jgi:AcrR family transcriptional regulator
LRRGSTAAGAKQRLVVAAVDLFTEQGCDATTVAQIAECAGVAKSTLFRRFSGKREPWSPAGRP